MGKAFDAFSLLDESIPKVDLLSRNNNPKDINLFGDTLGFLMEENHLLAIEKANLYKGITESNDDLFLINESFEDFFTAIKNFIKKIIDFFKKLIAKFWVRINSLFLADKYIQKHKDELSKFERIHEFKINGYEFTFSSDIPSTNPLVEITTLASGIIGFGKEEEPKVNDFTALKDKYKTLKDDNEKDLDTLRKNILKTKYSIDSSDFNEELFKVYRNGDTDKSEITIDREQVNQAYAFFKDYTKTKSEIAKEQKEVEKVYNEMKKVIDSTQNKKKDVLNTVSVADFTAHSTGSEKKISKEEYLDELNLTCRALAQRITDASNIHLLAYSAKLDAVRDKFMQDKTILYGAFKKILAKSEAAEIVYDIDSIPEEVI